MKKTITLSLLATSLAVQGMAQGAEETYPYDYAYSTQEYTPLENPTIILGNTGWDDELIPLTLDFAFSYKGEAVNDWILDTYGGIYINEQFLNDSMELPTIIGISGDYMDNGNSAIGYQITGAEGSRILKIEFSNVGFYSYEDETGLGLGNANYQIWLYEADNRIEYHVGPNEVDPALIDFMDENTPVITGLCYEAADQLIMHTINNNGGANTDSVYTFNPNDVEETLFLNLIYGPEYPAEGSVFSFTPPEPSAIKETAVQLINEIYPNPATDHFVLELKNAPAQGGQLSIATITGSIVATYAIQDSKTQIDLKGLAKGVYMVQYSNGAQKQSMRIIKK